MTERRRLYLLEQLLRLYEAQEGLCWTCGRIRKPEDMELAPRVAATKANIALYSRAAVDDDDNKRAVCRGGMRAGVSCNDACNLGGKPESARKLMERIQRKLKGAVVEV